MEPTKLKTVFGWMTLINFVVLIVSTAGVITFRTTIHTVHGSMFSLDPSELDLVYFQYLGWFKVLWIIFNLVPYIALRMTLVDK
jgi:hypothetical protein